MSRNVRTSIYQPSENTHFAWFSSLTNAQWRKDSILCSVYGLYQTKKVEIDERSSNQGKEKKKGKKGRRISGFA